MGQDDIWRTNVVGEALGLMSAETIHELSDEEPTPRALRERRHAVGAVLEVLADALNATLDRGWSRKEDLHDELSQWFADTTTLAFEEHPSTAAGRPTFLFEGLVALEVKLNPTRAEADRCIRQVLMYARDYFTIILVADTRRPRADRMRRLLEDHGHPRIPVVRYGCRGELGDEHFDERSNLRLWEG